MSKSTPPRLPSAAARALDVERASPDPPDAVRDGVFARVRHSVGLPPIHGPDGAPELPRVSPRTPLVSPAALAAVAVGAGLVAVLALRAPTTTASRAPTPAHVARAFSPSPPPTAPREERAPAPPFAVAAPSPRAARPDASAEDPFAVERRMLNEAQDAFTRGDTALALAALARHRSAFPRGGLAEDRDFLTARALAARGDVEGARRRAEEFRRRYPASLYLPALDETIP